MKNKTLVSIAFFASLISFSIAHAATFDTNLSYGMTNNVNVTQLQSFLTEQGLYNGPITGNFYNLTLNAVEAYQEEKGLPTTGYVGVLTRADINTDTQNVATTSTATSAVSLLQATSTPITSYCATGYIATSTGCVFAGSEPTTSILSSVSSSDWCSIKTNTQAQLTSLLSANPLALASLQTGRGAVIGQESANQAKALSDEVTIATQYCYKPPVTSAQIQISNLQLQIVSLEKSYASQLASIQTNGSSADTQQGEESNLYTTTNAQIEALQGQIQILQ